MFIGRSAAKHATLFALVAALSTKCIDQEADTLALHLVKKAEAKGLTVMRVADPAKEKAEA